SLSRAGTALRASCKALARRASLSPTVGAAATIRWMNLTRYLKSRKNKTSRQIVFEGERLDMQAVWKLRDRFYPPARHFAESSRETAGRCPLPEPRQPRERRPRLGEAQGGGEGEVGGAVEAEDQRAD